MRAALLLIVLVAERGCFGADSHEPVDVPDDEVTTGPSRAACTLSAPVLLDATLREPWGFFVTASGYIVAAAREGSDVRYALEIPASLDGVTTRGGPMNELFSLVDETHAVVRRADYGIDLGVWDGTEWTRGLAVDDGQRAMTTPTHIILGRGDTMNTTGIDVVPRDGGATVHLGPYGDRGGRSDFAWPIPQEDELWIVEEAGIRQTLDRFAWDGTRLAEDRPIAQDAFWSSAYLPRQRGGAWVMIGTADYGTGLVGDFALLDVGPNGTRRRVTLVEDGVGYGVSTSAVESDDGSTLAIQYSHGELPGLHTVPGYVTVLDTTTLQVLLPETPVAGDGEVRFRDGGFTLLLEPSDGGAGVVTQRIVCP